MDNNDIKEDILLEKYFETKLRDHRNQFPFMSKVRLKYLWMSIHLCIALLGALLSIYSDCNMTDMINKRIS